MSYAASGSSPVSPTDARLALEAGAESFRWREFDDDGLRLLTEQGPRFVLGASLGNFLHANSGPIFEMRLGSRLGEIDYDGQDNNGRFVGTVSDYSSWFGEVNGGYRFPDFVKGVTIDLFGGVGLDDWRREINGGVNSIQQSVAGFTEEYGVAYLRYGLGISLHGASPGGYIQLGFRRPQTVSEQVRIQGQSIDLSPGESASGFVSYQVALGAPRAEGAAGSYIKFYYAGYRFSKSEIEQIGSSQVWQPRSEADTLGVVLGFHY
ncbi:MAG: hypothetical protein IT488_11045 [Gammaproteobacteria bacterium]|nr:hypothetical protein [Gammaproteobacteria bacterium]